MPLTRKSPGAAGTATRANFQDNKQTKNTTPPREPVAPADDFGLILLDWRPHRSGHLRGYASIELKCGLVADGVPVFLGADGIARGSLPSHPSVESGVVVKVDDKVQYSRDFHWRDLPLASAWAEAVGALVRREYPEDFER